MSSSTAQLADALSVTGLSVRYGKSVAALKDVSLTVADGEVVALMGLNGAGKSTLARAVTGLLPAQGGTVFAGTIECFGRPITRRSARHIVRHGVAQSMEGRRIFGALTVEENIDLGGSTVPMAELRENRQRLYELFPRLAERRTQAAGLLSGGEQQMLALARGLMSSPRLFVMDEPTLGLSPKLVVYVRDTIRAIQAAGTSVLLIEQNATMALSVADRGYVIEHGRIVHEDTAADLREDGQLQRLLLGLGTEGAA
ncbi:ABC transporter ATP-binding protein [Microbacterium sp. SORGH_AS_0888]|uniref:ABC transporter ATP-binding protein n=1 Tax=Microbacterium sp. SORGH_AS_0888 TaxID=3041791 RepID=UPI00277E181F|nr:ABC transporter ATP-binding protein [Microbacterium sp. SORGH_AS_0888]MDQ1129693.1 branched-chain amino acid transport system ATP-binding protein [Microbacterium sp. SORGH_AS_0888]